MILNKSFEIAQDVGYKLRQLRLACWRFSVYRIRKSEGCWWSVKLHHTQRVVVKVIPLEVVASRLLLNLAANAFGIASSDLNYL